MATITLEGNEIHTTGRLPLVGSAAPDFRLTSAELTEMTLADFAGKKIILNIFPSLDTGVCAESVRHFNASIASISNVVVLCISADLPFAHSRFCSAEGIEGVKTLSTFRNPEFGDNYGVKITDGPIAGLMSRAIVVIDEKGTVSYTEQVPEIAQEPNYVAALAHVIDKK